jgi:hypothetical protein
MKTLIGAFALILAAPVAAQTAPAPDADHAQHHSKGAEHKMDCKCCEQMLKQHAGKMDCGDEHAEGHADHDGQPTQ